MIYTEYFVKGTQPTTICPLHPSPSFLDRLAGAVRRRTRRRCPVSRRPVGPARPAAPARPARPRGPRRAPDAASPRTPKAEADGRGAEEEARLLGRAVRQGRQERRRRRRTRRKPKKPADGLIPKSCRTRPDMIGFRRPVHAIPRHHRPRPSARADGAGSAARHAAAEPDFRRARGVGKRMAALALAQLVNCLAPVAARSRRLRRVRLLQADRARRARRRAAHRAGRDRVDQGRPGPRGDRAVGVPSVRRTPPRRHHRRGGRDGGEAQNALLKTLEEPPAASTFVLVTSRPDVLLPTVRSRCQRLRFGRLAPADVAAVLIARARATARPTRMPPRRCRTAASAARSRAARRSSSRRATPRPRLLEARRRVGRSAPPAGQARRRSGAGSGSGDRDELARRLRALSSMLRDLGVLLSRADERASPTPT